MVLGSWRFVANWSIFYVCVREFAIDHHSLNSDVAYLAPN